MNVPTDPARIGALDRGGLRQVVTVLSVTEITSWGILFYAFPVLAPAIAADTGWGLPALTAAFSAGQIVAALLGVVAGRLIDHRGPRVLMTAGSVLAVPALLVIALAPTYVVFLAGWLLAGVAMGGVLYPPAFAALTVWGGARRITALTTLTLVAGLASTVFAPLTAALGNHTSWRVAYLVLLVMLTVVTVPAHWLGLRHRWTPHPPRPGPDPAVPEKPVWRDKAFLLLAVTLVGVAFTVNAVVVNIVPLMQERGLTTTQAAFALALGGVGQVVGRIGYATLVAHTSPVSRIVLVAAALATGTVLLGVMQGPAVALFAVAAVLGMARGIATLVHATAASDRWGVHGFGRLNGLLSTPVLVTSALAPFVGALLADRVGSYSTAFLLIGCVGAAAAVTARWSDLRHQAPRGHSIDREPTLEPAP